MTLLSNRSRILGILGASMLLSACSEEVEIAAPPIRPVRVATAEQLPTQAVVTMTGRIEAADQASIGFRLSGRVMARPVKTGDAVEEGQVLAELEPQDQQNAVRSATAELVAARGRLTQATNHYERQRHLLERRVVSRADYEAAEQAKLLATAQLEAAEAQLRTAEDRLGFTVLRADARGTVTAVGAEPGEFVHAGQMIVRLARREGRDAVFDIPASLLDTLALDTQFIVNLVSDSSASTTGRVREIAPQADVVTRTFQVRVGLNDPPPSFRLGSAVVGSVKEDMSGLVRIPDTALTTSADGAAVWLVDPAARKVSRRKVEVGRMEPGVAWISNGLQAGDIVVTAGTGVLSEGQLVRLPGDES